MTSLVSLTEIKNAYRTMVQAAQAGTEISGAWQAFAAVVRSAETHPPHHLRLLLSKLDAYRGSRRRSQIAILDHGCGGGLSLLFLAALGFTDVFGVDLGGNQAVLNRLIAVARNSDEPRFCSYDGRHLPLPDSCIDVVFSQQVLEHVDDSLLGCYYGEEARVLKGGGLAIHQVPHRLTPYESHTGTWFLHYLPRPLCRTAAPRALRRPFPDHLHLRWPWVHTRMLRETIGGCQNVTLERLISVNEITDYDGPVRLRRAAGALLTAPAVGTAARALLPAFAMLETVSIKSRPRTKAGRREAESPRICS